MLLEASFLQDSPYIYIYIDAIDSPNPVGVCTVLQSPAMAFKSNKNVFVATFIGHHCPRTFGRRFFVSRAVFSGRALHVYRTTASCRLARRVRLLALWEPKLAWFHDSSKCFIQNHGTRAASEAMELACWRAYTDANIDRTTAIHPTTSLIDMPSRRCRAISQRRVFRPDEKRPTPRR